jgi:large conductance mechanosensitive channel
MKSRTCVIKYVKQAAIKFNSGALLMSIIKEFKEFALKGNMMDLAIGVIIGGAFGKIIDSLVKDIIMPLISVITGGGVDFTQKFIVLGDNPNNLQSLAELTKAGVNVLTYGNFLTIFINFIILAWVVFLMVKVMNRMRKQEEAAPAAPAATPEDIQLLREIRDSLKK